MKVYGDAYWASVQAPNDTFEPVWQVDLAVNAETAKALKAAGLNPRGNQAKCFEGIGEEPNGRTIFKIKRKVNNPKTNKPNKPPVCLGPDGKPFDDLIGNGSKVAVQINIYEWKNSFGAGVGGDFAAIRVLDLVEFRKPDGAELLEEGEDPSVLTAEEANSVLADDELAFDDDLPDVLA